MHFLMKSMRPKSDAAHAAFHRPWTVEEEEWWFFVRDHDGQQLAYVYFDDPRFSDQPANPHLQQRNSHIPGRLELHPAELLATPPGAR